jgi:hypothetical protein
MTDDFDVELRERLARIASGVTVEPPALVGVVSAGPVRAGSTTRRLALAGLVPLLVVGVVGTLLTGLAKVGPFAPGASETPGSSEFSGPLLATKRSGDFELTIRAAKGKYGTGEAIEIEATLAYLGQDPVVIHHAQGASVPGRGNVDGPDTGGRGGPIGFGVVEPVLGDLNLSPVWAESCERTTLNPAEEVAVPFQKNGAWSGNHPEYEAYLRDPILRLTAGIWHVYAVAEFSIGDCGAAQVQMRAELEITVLPRPGETPLPSVVNPPEPTTAPTDATDSDRDGDFELVLHAGKSHYRTDEPIDVTASLAYLGTEPSVEITTDGGPLSFAIFEKVFGAIRVGGVSLLTCDRTTLEQDRPLVEDFQKSGGFSNDHPDAKMFRDWMQDPELLLPEGTWHLSVSAGGPCLGDGPTFSVRAQIEIVVSDDPAATPGLPVPTDWADPPVYGGDDDGLAVLQLRSSHENYAEGTPIELEAKYWFADGPALVASRYEPELLLSITQLDAKNPTGGGTSYDTVCTDLGRVDGTEHQVALAGYNVAVMRADRVPARLEDLFVGGALVLPVGRWEINANVEGRFAPCGQAGDGYALSASIVIEVVPS